MEKMRSLQMCCISDDTTRCRASAIVDGIGSVAAHIAIDTRVPMTAVSTSTGFAIA